MDPRERALVDAPKAKQAAERLESIFESTRSGRREDTVEQLRREAAEHPDWPFVNLELGILLVDLNQHEAAVEAFRREIGAGGLVTAREAAWEMGSAYAHLGMNDAAVSAYEEALQYDPCCVEALFGLGNACVRRVQYDEAIEHYRDAVFLQPHLEKSSRMASHGLIPELVADLHLNLGAALILKGSPAEAKVSLEHVLEIAPCGTAADHARHHLALLTEFSEHPELLASELERIELPGIDEDEA